MVEKLPSNHPSRLRCEALPHVTAAARDVHRAPLRFAQLPFCRSLGLHRVRGLGRGRAGGCRRLLLLPKLLLPKLLLLLLLLLRLPGTMRATPVSSWIASELLVTKDFDAVHGERHLLAARDAHRLANIQPLASAQRAAFRRRPPSRR